MTASDTVFISCRPIGDRVLVSKIATSLRDRFGEAHIFGDPVCARGKGPLPGSVRQALERARVVLILWERLWPHIQEQLLDDPDDWMRQEVEVALHGENVVAIPVLIEDAELPQRSALPEPIAQLAGLGCLRITGATFSHDVEELLSLVEALLHSSRRPIERARENAESTDTLRSPASTSFTVFRPGRIRPSAPYRLLAFAHLNERRPGAPEGERHPLDEVLRQARRELGESFFDYQQTSDGRTYRMPREGELTFVPSVEGVEFTPLRQTVSWDSDVQRVDFRLRAAPTSAGPKQGALSIYLGSVLIADVPLTFVVSSDAPHDGSAERVSARPYRRIFASHSRKDTAIVRQLQWLAKAFGDRYLIDVDDLRSGEHWSDRLRDMIAEADVFQLFWSTRSMKSRFVKKEWTHALSLQRPKGFIRPVYWEKPLPRTAGLPPRDLERLHFEFIGSDGTEFHPRWSARLAAGLGSVVAVMFALILSVRAFQLDDEIVHAVQRATDFITGADDPNARERLARMRLAQAVTRLHDLDARVAWEQQIHGPHLEGLAERRAEALRALDGAQGAIDAGKQAASLRLPAAGEAVQSDRDVQRHIESLEAAAAATEEQLQVAELEFRAAEAAINDVLDSRRRARAQWRNSHASFALVGRTSNPSVAEISIAPGYRVDLDFTIDAASPVHFETTADGCAITETVSWHRSSSVAADAGCTIRISVPSARQIRGGNFAANGERIVGFEDADDGDFNEPSVAITPYDEWRESPL